MLYIIHLDYEILAVAVASCIDFLIFWFFFTALCILIIIYIFTECHVSPLTLPTWLTLRVFSHNILTSCHAPVSLDQSEPEPEIWRPMRGELVTCDEGRGDVTHHISSASLRSPGHVGRHGDTYQHLITKGDTDQETKHQQSWSCSSITHYWYLHYYASEREDGGEFQYFVVTHKTFNCCVWPSSGYDSIVSGSKC